MSAATLSAPARAPRSSAGALRLAVLAAACFTFVTTETQPVALLAPMARGLRVSEPTVGLLMTVYAGAAALTAIPLTLAAAHRSRRRVVIGTVAILVVSQAALALAPSYPVALVARLLGALAHGVFWSVLAQVVAALVPRERIGRATASVYAGNSVALVAGTPLVTALGALLGWRAAVAVMGVAALVTVIGMALVLPEVPHSEGSQDGRRALLAGALRHHGVRLVCGVTLLLAFGQFAAFTYLAPLVRAHTGLTGTGLSALLLAYGAAGVLGLFAVGRIADHRPRGALLTCCGLVIAGLALIVAVAHGTAMMVVAALAWGAGFTALPVCLQSAVLRVAPRMPDAASAVYVVAFQIGIGGGSLAGATLLRGQHLAWIPVLALGLFVAGSLLAGTARTTLGRHDRTGGQEPDPPAPGSPVPERPRRPALGGRRGRQRSSSGQWPCSSR